MPFVRTRISVAGFREDEVRRGLADLLDEFRHRPYLLEPNAYWDEARRRLVVTVASAGADPRIEGGTAGAILDDVWDSVIACLNFASDGIRFDVEDVAVLETL